eukprot:3058909-Amphidinium_carterae.1
MICPGDLQGKGCNSEKGQTIHILRMQKTTQYPEGDERTKTSAIVKSLVMKRCRPSAEEEEYSQVNIGKLLHHSQFHHVGLPDWCWGLQCGL